MRIAILKGFMRLFLLLALLLSVFSPHMAKAEVAEPSPRASDESDVMNWLSAKGMHDLKKETWNAYGQFTYISSWKSAFPAQYTNLNGSNHSLLPSSERSYTGTATLFLSVKPWHGTEIYVVPELIAAEALSNLYGLVGVIQNFELQKNGSMVSANHYCHSDIIPCL